MNRIIAVIFALGLVFVAFAGCALNAADDSATRIDDITSSEDNTARSDGDITRYPDNTDRTNGTLSFDATQSGDTEPPEDDDAPLFSYDKYWITAETRDNMSEREYTLYCKAVDSIIAGDGVVNGFESQNEFERVRLVLFSEFLPIRCMVMTYNQTSEPFTYENGTASFKLLGDRESRDSAYAELENIMNEALSLIESDDSDWQRIAKLFLYVSNHMTYGYVHEVYGVTADFYHSIVYRTGVCGDYVLYLNMLASQIGFETLVGHSEGKNGFYEGDHAWSMIKVEGEWYHFDACWESLLFTHENMDYFAFDTQVRHDSLANNNMWGMIGEVELFRICADNTRTELPYCENGMSASERSRIYLSVFEEYDRAMADEMPEDEVEKYLDGLISDSRELLDSGNDVWVEFEIKNGTMNSAVSDLIYNYSPQDMSEHPELENGADKFTQRKLVLKHVDLSKPKFMLYSIISEIIVRDSSVRLVRPD